MFHIDWTLLISTYMVGSLLWFINFIILFYALSRPSGELAKLALPLMLIFLSLFIQDIFFGVFAYMTEVFPDVAKNLMEHYLWLIPKTLEALGAYFYLVRVYEIIKRDGGK